MFPMVSAPPRHSTGPQVQADSESEEENPVDEATGLVGAHSMGSPEAMEMSLKKVGRKGTPP